MTEAEIRTIACAILSEIAPEADLKALSDKATLRDELDLDSMDFLNFVAGLHKRTGVDIPETDYPHLATLGGIVAYLRSHSGIKSP
jgi:acyl carrier protein